MSTFDPNQDEDVETTSEETTTEEAQPDETSSDESSDESTSEERDHIGLTPDERAEQRSPDEERRRSGY